MTIRLTQKVFSQEYADTESAKFQELSNELINTVSIDRFVQKLTKPKVWYRILYGSLLKE